MYYTTSGNEEIPDYSDTEFYSRLFVIKISTGETIIALVYDGDDPGISILQFPYKLISKVKGDNIDVYLFPWLPGAESPVAPLASADYVTAYKPCMEQAHQFALCIVDTYDIIDETLKKELPTQEEKNSENLSSVDDEYNWLERFKWKLDS